MKNPCAQAFKLIRLTNRITQEKMSKQLGVSESYVGQIEQGKSFPAYEMLCKVIEVYDVDANLFFGNGNSLTVIDNSFYKLVSNMTPEQIDEIRGVLKFVTNVSMLQQEIVDGED